MNTQLTPLDDEAMYLAGLNAVREAERARNRVYARRKEIREQARRHLQLRAHADLPWWRALRTPVESIPVSQRLLKVVTNAWASNDPECKGHIDDNKWFLAQASAYGANGSPTGRLPRQPVMQDINPHINVRAMMEHGLL